jgi:hypothetical protein
MKLLPYFIAFVFLTAITVSCKKQKNDDVSFIKTDAAPKALSALFTITQDNTGLVTITPNGEGISFFEVYYGDGTTVPVKILPGKNIQHVYAEGVYNVKIVGHSITGIVTEATQQLTVSFRAPENLEVSAEVDASNNFKLNVSATAQYETFFKVYFGDNPNEVPVSFLEGETISHVYASTGNYTIKVIAYSGGAAVTEFTKTITIADPVLLPLTFESATLQYGFVNFGGGDASVIANPQQNGINTSAKVGRMIKYAPEGWGGSFISLSAPIDFSANKIFRMKVFSPRVGARVLLKVENATDGGINFEKEATCTVANAWEDLVFDYSAINTANTYHKVVLIFELGTPGDGSANFTFLFDDIRLTNTLPSTQVNMPVTFESTEANYSFTNFGNATSTVVNNPHVDANNTSAKVARFFKPNGAETWAGSFLELGAPIDFSSLTKIKMKVWSPTAGIKVLMKLENLANSSINIERDVTNTVANGWEELVFDFAGINNANQYQRLVVFFDFGNSGNGAEYYYDDIALTSGADELVLPLTFQSSTLTYSFTGFGNANATVVDNPSPTGINTSTKVGALTKASGAETWAGSFIELQKPIDFSALTKIKMKVWSPASGIKVLMKLENLANSSINIERDVTNSVANGWEELTFDFNGIVNSNNYQRLVVFFDFGNSGTGATYYFDDVKLSN